MRRLSISFHCCGCCCRFVVAAAAATEAYSRSSVLRLSKK